MPKAHVTGRLRALPQQVAGPFCQGAFLMRQSGFRELIQKSNDVLVPRGRQIETKLINRNKGEKKPSPREFANYICSMQKTSALWALAGHMGLEVTCLCISHNAHCCVYHLHHHIPDQCSWQAAAQHPTSLSETRLLLFRTETVPEPAA